MARSPLKLSIKDLLAKISAQDLLDYQSEHHATTRAIWQAQSAERVARAIWKWARRHNQSYLAGLKWRDGCASTCLNFTTHCTHHKKWRLKMMFCLGFGQRSLKYCPCHGKWARDTRSTAPATPNHHHVQNQKGRQFHKTRPATLSKLRPRSPNIAPATRNDRQNHLSFLSFFKPRLPPF